MEEIKRQPENAHLGYSDTPVLPSGYHVHDGARPQPPAVTPGEGNQPPSDAIVLFSGGDLSQWQKADGSGPAEWKVADDYFEVAPKTGNIASKQEFGDLQLHLEFASPAEVQSKSQGRGNSGVFLMGLYEVQVLDNYENPTYPDGTVGGLYGQWPPLYNAIRKPGEWNCYDIFWRAPRYSGGQVQEPAVITVMLNHVLLHHAKPLMGPTKHKDLTEYPKEHNETGPVVLQDHGDLVRFRNIWARMIKQYDQDPPVIPFSSP